MTLFGDTRRPWLLGWGIEEESDLAHAMKRLAPVVTFLKNSHRANSQVRQDDYDAAVVIGQLGDLAAHLNILQFGGTAKLDSFVHSDGEAELTYIVQVYSNGRAGQLEVPTAGVPPEVENLARSSLAPWLLTENPRDVLRESIVMSKGTIEVPSTVQAFVKERDGLACAGLWRRPTSSLRAPIEHWWLPEKSPDPVEWLEAALTRWRGQNEGRFPGPSDWILDPRWMTASEIGAHRKLAEAQTKLESDLAALTAERDDASRRLLVERENANVRQRLLLTAQGEELKHEVHAALSDLGFNVVDSDELRTAEGSELREDLEVHDDSGWVAIAEVRGYSRGAKTSDFQRLARAARGFEKRNGCEPNRRWYVVNHNLTKAPVERRAVLAGSESDIEEFKIDQGCVIDTRDLFRLREIVNLGKLGRGEAQQSLRDALGVFTHPALSSG